MPPDRLSPAEAGDGYAKHDGDCLRVSRSQHTGRSSSSAIMGEALTLRSWQTLSPRALILITLRLSRAESTR